MLQKYLLFVFLVNPAQAMVFKAPEVSETRFQQESLRLNQSPYAAWVFDQSQNDTAEAHEQVSEFVHDLLQNPSRSRRRIQDDWNNLRSALPLNRADREMLLLAAEKINLPDEMCRYVLLEKDLLPSKVDFCLKMARPVSTKLKSLLKERDVLLIDGKPFYREQIPSRLVAGSYQWRWISSEFQDRSFTGTVENMARLKFEPVSWVQGSCRNPKLALEEFRVLSQALIVFPESCSAPALQTKTSLKSWAGEHETLLWTIGLMVGGFAAYQLRNKDIVFTGFK